VGSEGQPIPNNSGESQEFQKEIGKVSNAKVKKGFFARCFGGRKKETFPNLPKREKKQRIFEKKVAKKEQGRDRNKKKRGRKGQTLLRSREKA